MGEGNVPPPPSARKLRLKYSIVGALESFDLITDILFVASLAILCASPPSCRRRRPLALRRGPRPRSPSSARAPARAPQILAKCSFTAACAPSPPS